LRDGSWDNVERLGKEIKNERPVGLTRRSGGRSPRRCTLSNVNAKATAELMAYQINMRLLIIPEGRESIALICGIRPNSPKTTKLNLEERCAFVS
jgi:hypothetical protein